MEQVKKSKKSAIENIYKKYEYLATQYSNKIFNFERYGYEKEDILQEFRIKIYTSIISYASRWAEYKETGKYKPVPIKFYIKSAMVNKTKDFIKLFNSDTVENKQKISIQKDEFDYSEHSSLESELDLNNSICIINGVDLFYGLVGRKRQIFSLFLKGFTIPDLSDKFEKIDVIKLISNQIDYLKTKKHELNDFAIERYSTVSVSDD